MQHDINAYDINGENDVARVILKLFTLYNFIHCTTCVSVRAGT